MSDITKYGPSYDLIAARVLTVEGSAIVKTALFYPRLAAFTPQVTTIPFEGGGKSQTVDVLTRVDLALTCDKLNMMQRAKIFAKDTVATPFSGMAEGVWYGDEAEVAGVAVGLELDAAFKDESVTPHVSGRVRRVFPRGTLKTLQPQQMEYQGKLVDVLNFSFERAEVDLLDDPLPDVPDGGAVYLEGTLL